MDFDKVGKFNPVVPVFDVWNPETAKEGEYYLRLIDRETAQRFDPDPDPDVDTTYYSLVVGQIIIVDYNGNPMEVPENAGGSRVCSFVMQPAWNHAVEAVFHPGLVDFGHFIRGARGSMRVQSPDDKPQNPLAALMGRMR